MNSFFVSRKKIIELLLLPLFLGALYFFYPILEAASLFAFGYIWNWSASNDLEQFFKNKRYRFSLISLVVNTQSLLLKPFASSPELLKSFIKIFPAGIFWLIVIYINASHMPWWATFLGSFIFEVLQIELSLFRRQRDES